MKKKTQKQFLIDGSRNYLPSFAELIDRMSIINLKSLKIKENKDKIFILKGY
jgi:hypothetical protein